MSVIINTYNNGRFIEDAIDSAVAQDFPAEQFEVIVVDDGSTDDTAEHVKKYGDRIRYLYKENGDQCSAITFGVNQAKGDLVAFLDGDDVWLPNKLSRVVEEFAKDSRTTMVYHKYLFWNPSDNTMWEDPHFAQVSGDVLADRRKVLTYAGAPTSSLAFRRDRFEPLTRIPLDRPFTYDAFLFTAVLFLGPIACIPEILTKNRIHGNNRWMAGPAGPGPATLRRRAARWGAMIDIVQDWTRGNAPESAHLQARILLQRWSLIRENYQFALKPPGRIEFLRHQLRANRLANEVLGAKLRAINRVNVFASLITGYQRFGALDTFWRKLDRTKDRLASLFSQRSARGQARHTQSG